VFFYKGRYTAGKMTISLLSLMFCIIIFSLTSSSQATDNGYEQPVQFKASTILKPELLKGKNHKVLDQVKNDGLFNHYTVESAFGIFRAASTNDLKILIREINAIAAMKQVETDDTALASLKQSGENTVSGIKNLFTDPQGTLQGAASGVGSLFNRARETIGKREVTEAEDSRLEQLIGVSKSKGAIATKYGVNVYSRNQILQEELDRLGQADFLGGLGVGVATSFVPGVGGLVLSASGTARLLNEAINTTPASELWLQNKNKLLAMDMDADTIELFLNNPSFSPALYTVLVTSLESMSGVDNRKLFIKVALQASDPQMAKTIVKMAVMSAGFHKEIAPLESFAPMARITQGIREDKSRVVFLPVDHLLWNQRVAETATAVSGEAKGSDIELYTLGTLSKLATAELQKLGWKVYTDAGPRLIPAR
jgi:hypothetical protein